MKKIETEYEKSALFNWFRGRVLRLQVTLIQQKIPLGTKREMFVTSHSYTFIKTNCCVFSNKLILDLYSKNNLNNNKISSDIEIYPILIHSWSHYEVGLTTQYGTLSENQPSNNGPCFSIL